MHGARLKMADGKMAQLRLAASEEFGFLRIKAEIPVSDTPKPLTTSVPIFETALMADDHCDPQILTIIDEPIPAEIDGDRLEIGRHTSELQSLMRTSYAVFGLKKKNK